MGVIKESQFETCGHCGHRTRVADEERGCDVCAKAFGDAGCCLQIDIFSNTGSGVDRIDCCSWRCVLKALPTIKCDYFVSLPYLHYDAETADGARAQDFFDALKELSSSVAPR